jgi:hypothetical protein
VTDWKCDAAETVRTRGFDPAQLTRSECEELAEILSQEEPEPMDALAASIA